MKAWASGRAVNVFSVTDADDHDEQLLLLYLVNDPVAANPGAIVSGVCKFADSDGERVLGKPPDSPNDPPLDGLGKFVALLLGLGGKFDPEGPGHGLANAPGLGHLIQGDGGFPPFDLLFYSIGQFDVQPVFQPLQEF